MNIVVVVEGQFDQMFIEALAADLLKSRSVSWIVANGKNAARPLARRYILSNAAPVLLVLDADTTDEEAVAAQQSDLDAYLRWSGGEYRSAAILFKPEIEEVFFSSPSFVKRVFADYSGGLLGRIAILSPKEALTLAPLSANILTPDKFKAKLNLKGSGGARWDVYLTALELKEMRRHPRVALIRAFIKRMTTNALVARV